MAGTSSPGSLCCRLHGCHLLPCEKRKMCRKKAVYIACGIDMVGKKMYWECISGIMKVLNSGCPSSMLKNRGVEDILLTCVDGLSEFPQAIEAVYPQTEIQRCIIHQIRNTTRYVSYKDLKKVMADLQKCSTHGRNSIR